MVRKVKHLELNFSDSGISSSIQSYNYTLCQNFINQEFGESLKSLVLKDVVVKADIMGFLFDQCLCLESLMVDGNVGINELVCLSPNNSLKSLTIKNWDALDTVRLSRFKLVSLDIQVVAHMDLTELKELVKLNLIGFSTTTFLYDVLSTLPQLECLRITTGRVESPQNLIQLMGRLDFNNLRSLDINPVIDEDMSLLFLFEILPSLPCLEDFILRVPCNYLGDPCRFFFSDIDINRAERTINQLKSFKFLGYAATFRDAEMLCCIAARAKNLVKIELSIVPFRIYEEQYLAVRQLRVEKQAERMKQHGLIRDDIDVSITSGGAEHI